jgi:hypothetical protein
MKKSVISLLFVVVSLSLVSASLGISPPKLKYDFSPGETIEVTFRVYSDHPDRTYSFDIVGDLKDYVVLSTDKLVGGGEFKAFLTLPDNLSKPGENNAIIWVKEGASSTGGALGTSLNVGGIIIVFMPFPGKYAEVSMSVPNGNVNELIPVWTNVVSKGEDEITVDVKMNFYNDKNELIDKIQFTPVNLKTNEERIFQSELNTDGYKAGTYWAESVVDYGEGINKVNRTFRVGSLFVNVTNFTQELPLGGIKKFNVDIESKWNDPIREVFAIVNITREGESFADFQTPSVSLAGWEIKRLEGFIETDGLESEYDSEIVLHYSGQTTVVNGKLKIIPPVNYMLIIGIAAGSFVIVVVIALTIWLIRRWKKKNILRKKKRK